jgi:hypothetical protein
VILDRMSHEVPYYAVYLKMAALQGTYCINNVFWRSADDKFFGYAIAEKLGIHEPKTVVLPNKAYVEDVDGDSLRNLWPVDFSMYLDHAGCPCIMKPAFGGGWRDVYKLHRLEGLQQRYEILPRALRDKAEELSLRFNEALGYDMNALEFAVVDDRFIGIDLTNYTPDLDYRSLKDAHFPWAVEKMAELCVEKALSEEPTPTPPDRRSLVLR